MKRRELLRTAGGIGAASVLSGIGLSAMTGGAAGATVSFTTSVTGTDISNDEGDVDYVGVDMEKDVSWDGFDVPLLYVGFKHEITIEDGGSTGWHTLYDSVSGRLSDWSTKDNGGDGWGGPGEYVKRHSNDDHEGNNPEALDYTKGAFHADISWAVVSDGSHPDGYDSVQTPVDWTEQLSVDADGATETRVLKFRTTLTFYTENEYGNMTQITEDDGVPQVQGEDTFAVDVTNEPKELTGSESGSSTAE